MAVEPLLGPIIRRRYMSCAPPPSRREPRMGTNGSAAGGTSILNSQISILFENPVIVIYQGDLSTHRSCSYSER
jgi:hypothetical protein